MVKTIQCLAVVSRKFRMVLFPRPCWHQCKTCCHAVQPRSRGLGFTFRVGVLGVQRGFRGGSGHRLPAPLPSLTPKNHRHFWGGDQNEWEGGREGGVKNEKKKEYTGCPAMISYLPSLTTCTSQVCRAGSQKHTPSCMRSFGPAQASTSTTAKPKCGIVVVWSPVDQWPFSFSTQAAFLPLMCGTTRAVPAKPTLTKPTVATLDNSMCVGAVFVVSVRVHAWAGPLCRTPLRQPPPSAGPTKIYLFFPFPRNKPHTQAAFLQSKPTLAQTGFGQTDFGQSSFFISCLKRFGSVNCLFFFACVFVGVCVSVWWGPN